MRLTWRDAASTVLAAVVLVFTLAAVRDWGWPLLGSFRSATIVIAIVGLVMVGFGTAAREVRWSDPFMAVDGVIGVAAVVLFIIAMFAASQGWFVAFAAAVLAMWLVPALRHVVEHEPAGPGHHAAAS